MENTQEKFYIKWWGCASVEITIADINLVIDPYVHPDEPIYDYIFCTQEHFDHFHRETLLKLCKGPRFKKLIVNIGCVSPGQPIEKVYGAAALTSGLPADFLPQDQLQVLHPKYFKGESNFSFEKKSLIKRNTKELKKNRTFEGISEMQLGRLAVEAVESGEEPSPDIPSNGYLITDTKTNLSFYHTGDIWETYPNLEKLKDRVDFLFHMKMGWNGKWELLRQLVEYVRPRYFVPIHYRTDSASYPIQRLYEYGEPIEVQVKKHWIPDIDDPNAYIETLREHIGNLTQIAPFTAGRSYEILMPSKTIRWEWKMRS